MTSKPRSIPTKKKPSIRPFIDDKHVKIRMVPNEKKDRIVGFEIELKKLKLKKVFKVRRGIILKAFQKLERWYARNTSKTV